MDLNQLMQALQAQRSGLVAPQYNPAQVAGMQDQADLLLQQAQSLRSQPAPLIGGSGAMNAATTLSGRMRADRDQKRALEQLQQAYNAQSGIDAYAAQMKAIDEQMQKLRDEQIARDRFEQEQATKQANALALKQFEVDNRAPPKADKRSTQVVTMPSADGKTQRQAIVDTQTGEVIKVLSESPSKSDSEVSGKDLDIQEALGVLDNAEKMLDNAPMLSGTGPIQGKIMGLSEWNQQFQATTDHLFAVAKRIYKTKGEGQFSDADARALQGMLISTNRNEDVNKQIIQSLRRSLSSRSPNFQSFIAEVQPLLTEKDQPKNKVGRYIIEAVD